MDTLSSLMCCRGGKHECRLGLLYCDVVWMESTMETQSSFKMCCRGWNARMQTRSSVLRLVVGMESTMETVFFDVL